MTNKTDERQIEPLTTTQRVAVAMCDLCGYGNQPVALFQSMIEDGPQVTMCSTCMANAGS